MNEEYEIPNGSRLYFSKSANLKRKIEKDASDFLIESEFEEILTPYFFDIKNINEQNAIHIKTEGNNFLSLRPDSTIEVLRLALNRIGNSVQKWFYIQPVFSYPSNEYYQIGIEYINFTNMSYIFSILTNLLAPYKINYTLQVSNINIVNLLVKNYKINKEILSPINLEQVLGLNIEWISSLAHVHKLSDLDDLSIYPKDIQEELVNLKKSVEDMSKYGVSDENVVIEPLYYDELRYYESIYFRAFIDNTLLAKGGIYKDSGVVSSGFAIYTDQLISKIVQKGNY